MSTPKENGKRDDALSSMLKGLLRLIDLSGCVIAAACLSFMFVVLLFNVIMRYAFGQGIAWAYEIHSLLLPWLVGGGIVIASSRGRQIAVTLVRDLLGDKGQYWLGIIVNAIIAFICIEVVWTGMPIVKASHFQRLSTINITQYWGYMSLIYAFIGMAVIAIIHIILALRGDKDFAQSSTGESFS